MAAFPDDQPLEEQVRSDAIVCPATAVPDAVPEMRILQCIHSHFIPIWSYRCTVNAKKSEFCKACKGTVSMQVRLRHC